MGLHKKWFSRGVRSDEGYEIAFVGTVPRGRKLRYSEGGRSVTCVGEQNLIADGTRRRWGLHFALDPEHLTRWDDGSELSVAERERIQERIHALLNYIKFPHSFDRRWQPIARPLGVNECNDSINNVGSHRPSGLWRRKPTKGLGKRSRTC